MVDVVSATRAVNEIHDGMTIMIGGFLGIGEPLGLIDALAHRGVSDLTLIACVGAYPGGSGFGVGKLARGRQISRLITSHIGTDPELVRQYIGGEIDVEFNPMGTWIERIRCGGGGLGGVLTRTGLGTEIAEGRRRIEVEGQTYLLYPPLKADFALIKAHRADSLGNLQYRGTALNANPVMAMAAERVIAEVDEIVEVGSIPPNQVGTPQIFVDTLVTGNSPETRKQTYTDLWVGSGRLR
ncbi:CoA transferase subunit A [Sedimenticola sp.]|uniref:CoA transferase subunit A n=1 Tax=Sedimenticola sp. TaxID=1940285 RepID=UPI003D119396